MIFDKFSIQTDEEWLRTLIRSINEPVIDGVEFAAFPDPSLQAMIVGSSGEHALREAFNFYGEIKRNCQAAEIDLGAATVLDFGVGWGRFARIFAREVDQERLFGVDVMHSMVDVCRITKVPASISRIQPRGLLPFRTGLFDVAFAYSVFTHLPEPVHLHWLSELARVLKPGAVLVMTVEPRRFIEFCRSVPADTENQWYAKLSAQIRGEPDAERKFDAGEFVFMASGGGKELPPDTYGDAVIPLAYITKVWSKWFDVTGYLDDVSRFWQAVVSLRRKAD